MKKMKNLRLHRLVRHIIRYQFLWILLVFLAVKANGVSGGSGNPKTKYIVQNIRKHLTRKAEESIQQKTCESGLALCKTVSKKEEEEKWKNEKIKQNFRIKKDPHKPVENKNRIKNVIRTVPSKDFKSRLRKLQKDQEKEKSTDSLRQQTINKMTTEEKRKGKRAENKREKTNEKKSVETPKLDSKKKKKIQKKIEDQVEEKLRPKLEKMEKDKRKKVSRTNNENAEKVEGKKSGRSSKESDQESDFTFPVETFFFSMKSNEMNADLCLKHKNIYLRQLKKYKVWALMMFDASAKLPSGILQGNINQYGDFDECLSINAIFKKSNSKEPSGIKGKYCLAEIDVMTDSEDGNLRETIERIKSFSFIKSTIYDPGHFIPRFSSINWGLCVPDTCPAEDVEKLINYQLKEINATTDFVINARVKEDNCVVKDDLKFELNSVALAVIGFYATVAATAIYATYSDLKAKKGKDRTLSESEKIEKESEGSKGKLENLIMAFSLKKNLKQLFEEENEDSIRCINGLKAVFSLMLYFAHKTIPLGWTSFSNRIFFTKTSNHSSTILLRTSMIYTDSFLLMSGLLTTYSLSKQIVSKGKISWAKVILARIIRLTPILLAVLLFYAHIWDSLGSGPLWNVLVKKNSLLCRKYMWRNLLYIQNFFAFENMCAPQTHQLAMDMQLSLFAPLFVQLLHRHDKVGFGILKALFLVSSIARYILTSKNDLSIVIYHGMPVSQLYKTADLLYAQTLLRASPYLMGAIVGHYLQKGKGPFRMSRAFATLGWIVAFSLGFYTILSPSKTTLKEFEYDVTESAEYAALSPVAWSVALAWLIVACHLGFGGILNQILCNKGLLIFSRISYSFYLTQFLVFFYNVGVKRIPEMFTLIGCFDMREFAAVSLVSIVATLLFDIPMLKIKKIILEKRLTNCETDSKASESSELEKSVRKSESEKDPFRKKEILNEIEDQIQKVFEKKIIESAEEEDEEEGDDGYDYDKEEIKEEDVDSEESEEMEIDENYPVRPLRRSTRMDFDDLDVWNIDQ